MRRRTHDIADLRQMDEAQALSVWNTPQIDFHKPGIAYRDYLELKEEGDNNPDACPMAKIIANAPHSIQ